MEDTHLLCDLNEIQLISSRALEKGTLEKIPTSFNKLKANGMEFIVYMRHFSKVNHSKRSSSMNKINDPFAQENIEEDLFVQHLGNYHSVMLNKYNIIDNHILLITKENERQETPLNLHDFRGLFTILESIPSLAFFNCGEHSGMSQPHKHIQFIPLESIKRKIQQSSEDSEGFDVVPLRSILPLQNRDSKIQAVEALPFHHLFCAFHPNDSNAEFALQCYETMLKTLQKSLPTMHFSYNLIVMKEFMLLVPRRLAYYNGFSINSMGFIGAFIVKNDKQYEVLKEKTPFEILRYVAFPYGN